MPTTRVKMPPRLIDAGVGVGIVFEQVKEPVMEEKRMEWKSCTDFAPGARIALGGATYRTLLGGVSAHARPAGFHPDGFMDGSILWVKEQIMEEKRFEDINVQAIGHEIVMVGVVFQGAGEAFLAMYPEQKLDAPLAVCQPMTTEQWAPILEQSDFLGREVEVVEQDGSIAKAILRKSQRQIDGYIQWRVLRRDGFRCRYCGRDDSPLTVDHVIPWESRGPTVEANLLASCKKDNRVRGDMPYAEWLKSEHYQRVSANLTAHQREANLAVLDVIPTVKLVKRQRSRIIDSGICLQDHASGRRDDQLLSLESLPSVIREAIRARRLHVYRPVEPRNAYLPRDDWDEDTPE